MDPFEATPSFHLIPLWKIANEFRTTVQELLKWYEALGIPIGKVAGKPAIERSAYISAYDMTVDKPVIQQNQPDPPPPEETVEPLPAETQPPAELQPAKQQTELNEVQDENPFNLPECFQQFALSRSEQGLVADFIDEKTAFMKLAEEFWAAIDREASHSHKTVIRLIQNNESSVTGKKLGKNDNDPWVVDTIPFAIYALKQRRLE